MRYSYQREVIREIICSTKSHPTADWVYSDENLIRYDGNTDEHHHLKCSECGVLIDTNIKSNFDEKDIVSKYNFKPEKTNFFIIGKCNKHK